MEVGDKFVGIFFCWTLRVSRSNGIDRCNKILLVKLKFGLRTKMPRTKCALAAGRIAPALVV
jgi:hypothetical protein